MIRRDTPKSNARGDHVRPRRCRLRSKKRESPCFSCGECQLNKVGDIVKKVIIYTLTKFKCIVYDFPFVNTLIAHIRARTTLTATIKLVNKVKSAIVSSTAVQGVIKLKQKIGAAISSEAIVSATMKLKTKIAANIEAINNLSATLKLRIKISALVTSKTTLSADLKMYKLNTLGFFDPKTFADTDNMTLGEMDGIFLG